ncbi:serine carboxypeptidase-like 34 [Iris pallida]|uniref:Serine carboxypeptidase-like 34 n=1 Tax=Iris pallida TaxID=29817 RepID=A0AAX6GWX0_IRIPA|nr:serine carboxypeptidase-like 34 [Iris pallida]
MIGNAVMDEEADNRGLIDYAWHHAVISDRLYETIKLNCDFSIQNVSRTCSAAVDEYYDVYDIIDMYSLYSPTCARTESTSRKLWKIGGKGPMFLAKLKKLHQEPAGYDPCASHYSAVYFNRPDVQTALHANVSKMSYKWTHCSDVINGWGDSPFSMLPTMRETSRGRPKNLGFQW